MKKNEPMFIVLVVRTKERDYTFFCDEFCSQEDLFAQCVAECIKYDIPYKTNVLLYDNLGNLINRFRKEE